MNDEYLDGCNTEGLHSLTLQLEPPTSNYTFPAIIVIVSISSTVSECRLLITVTRSLGVIFHYIARFRNLEYLHDLEPHYKAHLKFQQKYCNT